MRKLEQQISAELSRIIGETARVVAEQARPTDEERRELERPKRGSPARKSSWAAPRNARAVRTGKATSRASNARPILHEPEALAASGATLVVVSFHPRHDGMASGWSDSD
jgi:hypothetical protein